MRLVGTKTMKLEGFQSGISRYGMILHCKEEEKMSYESIATELGYLKGYRRVNNFCEDA